MQVKHKSSFGRDKEDIRNGYVALLQLNRFSNNNNAICFGFFGVLQNLNDSSACHQLVSTVCVKGYVNK